MQGVALSDQVAVQLHLLLVIQVQGHLQLARAVQGVIEPLHVRLQCGAMTVTQQSYLQVQGIVQMLQVEFTGESAAAIRAGQGRRRAR